MGYRFLAVALACSMFALSAKAAGGPAIRMTTSMGVIEIELNAQKAPLTVANFLRYVKEGFYNGTIFHRVIPDFMIQGGGFTPDMKKKPTHAPIANEADNGLSNIEGAVAMARLPAPDSATSQFFINTVDNYNLNFRDESPEGWGYAVFGHVSRGMDVVHRIERVATGNYGDMGNVPLVPVVIRRVELVQ